MLTYDDVEDAIEAFYELPCYDQLNMKLSVGSLDGSFKVFIDLFSRIDIENLPKEICGVGVIYRYAQSKIRR